MHFFTSDNVVSNSVSSYWLLIFQLVHLQVTNEQSCMSVRRRWIQTLIDRSLFTWQLICLQISTTFLLIFTSIVINHFWQCNFRMITFLSPKYSVLNYKGSMYWQYATGQTKVY